MTDQDVGRIWASVLAGGMKSPEDTQVVKELIRKLVEERAHHIQQIFNATRYFEEFIPDALKDFGIDPKTFKHG